jgi:secretion/DNA translocation related TadE-like protein
VLLLVGSALGVVAALVRAHRMAQTAADLSALAAAVAHQRGGPACGEAARVAQANGADLAACHADGAAVEVAVVVTGPRWLGQHGDLEGTARAGPG